MEAVIVDAIRTPIGKRGGSLAGVSSVELLRTLLVELLKRAPIEASEVDQVVGGCVTQVGEQGLNVTRNAWLASGMDYRVGCTTVDVSCGSSQQANHAVASMIRAGAIDVGIACGVESMSRVPLGTNVPDGHDAYKPGDYPWDDPPHLQFGGAERIALRDGLTRDALDAFGLRSQQLAARAWDEGRFDREVLPLEVSPGGEQAVVVTRDEGLRSTSLAALGALRPAMRGGMHTAGTTSQVSDGAAAIMWMSERRAAELSLRPRARLVAQAVVGCDPYYLLDGPIGATRLVLSRAGVVLDDIDLYEVNEAFASVPLAWCGALRADVERLNVNGGAIALGHPVGATGTRLLVTALHELERRGARRALVTMCCGGALGTGSIIERL